MILNEELLDPKEREIVKLNLKINRLEKTIKDFKEYDTERKKYYSELTTKIGELESYIEELENGTALTKLRKKCEEQSKQLSALNAKKYLENFEIADITAITTVNKLQLQDKVKNLTNRVKSQKKIISELLSKLNVQQKREKIKTQIMGEITKGIQL